MKERVHLLLQCVVNLIRALLLELRKLDGNSRLYEKLMDCSGSVTYFIIYLLFTNMNVSNSPAGFRKKMYLSDIRRVSIDLCLLIFLLQQNTQNWKSGKIVLHLLIIGILGYDWDECPSVGIHPNFMPSQTPTIHPYGFVWHINCSVPKRNVLELSNLLTILRFD